MKTHLHRLFCAIAFNVIFGNISFASATQFTASANRGNVLPAPTGATPVDAIATAEFDLISLGLGEYALDYEITIVGLDAAAFRPTATGFDTANTQDNLSAIHMHFVPSGSSVNRGTPHVLNILGAPLTMANGISTDIEDDLAVDSFDLSSLTTVFSGRWDEADVVQTAGLAAGPRTKPVADFLDELLNGEIFLMLHTTGDPTGAIGGTLFPVPEPASVVFAVVPAMYALARRRFQ